MLQQREEAEVLLPVDDHPVAARKQLAGGLAGTPVQFLVALLQRALRPACELVARGREIGVSENASNRKSTVRILGCDSSG